jgi:hypothetical protein
LCSKKEEYGKKERKRKKEENGFSFFSAVAVTI